MANDNVLVSAATLTKIGDAIREKNGTVVKYKPSEMAGQIKNLSSSSTSADFSSVFNFKKVTIDPALHAKSVKISLLDGDNELTTIHNDDLGMTKSSFKIEPTLESGYLPSNIYTAKIDSTNDALYVTGEACTAPPQFPSKYVMTKQNFTVDWSTGNHVDLENDKLFSSIDIATDSIKLNLKSDVSISNLTFSNKKKLTIKYIPTYSSSDVSYECIGETTFDTQNMCIIIDKTNGLSNFNELERNSVLTNLYLKDSDFKILNEQMKITDYSGTDRDTVKFFYLSEKEPTKTFLADIGDFLFSDRLPSDSIIEKIKTNAGSYFYLINPLVRGSTNNFFYYFSTKDNKLMIGNSTSSSPFVYQKTTNDCNFYTLSDSTLISNYDWYTVNKSNYYDFSKLEEHSPAQIFEILYSYLTDYYSELSKNYYGDKTEYDKQINELANKTDSEKQTLVENAKTNFLNNLTYQPNLYNFSGGFNDENVTKLFSMLIYKHGMYTLKNSPTVNWKFEVDV